MDKIFQRLLFSLEVFWFYKYQWPCPDYQLSYWPLPIISSLKKEEKKKCHS